MRYREVKKRIVKSAFFIFKIFSTKKVRNLKKEKSFALIEQKLSYAVVFSLDDYVLF
jgi:hypothetical protein